MVLKTVLKRTKTILAILLAVLVLIVGFQNNTPAQIHVLFWTVTVNRLVLFLALFFVGAAAGSLATWMGGRRKKDEALPGEHLSV